MSARKRSSCSTLSTSPWRRYSPAWATAPAGAVDSAVISASGSASPPSASSATLRSRSASRSRSQPLGPAAAAAEDAAQDDARAVEHVVDERLGSSVAARVRAAHLAGSRPGSRSTAAAVARISVSAVVTKRSTAAHLRSRSVGRSAGAPPSISAVRRSVSSGRRQVAERVEARLARGGERRRAGRRSAGRARRRPSRAARGGRRRARARRATRCRAPRRRGSRPLAVVGLEQRLAAVALDPAVADLVAGRLGAQPARAPAAAAQQLLGREASSSTGSRPRPVDRAAPRLDVVLDRARRASGSRRRCRGSGRRLPRVRERAVEPVVAQALEVLDGRLRPGQDDEVGALDVGRRAREAHAHAGLGGERVDVGEVAHPAQAEHGDVERVARRRRLGPRGLQRERVLGVDPQVRRRTGSTPSVGRPVSSSQLRRARARGSRRRRGTC